MSKARKGGAGPGLRLAAVNGAEVQPAGAAPGGPVVSRHSVRDAASAGTRGGPITAVEVAEMDDAALGYIRSIFSADLAVIEAEYRARQELAEQEVKRVRRAIVDSALRRTQGEVLTAEAGNDISYVYSGTPWKLSAASARQRGLPEGLVGRMVCYAWGKPLLDDGRPQPMAAAPSSALRHDADEDDIPF